jgi:hypothetical protein
MIAASLAAPVATWLTAARVRAYCTMTVAIFGLGFIVWTVLALPSGVDPHGKPVGYDFITFWSAARLALDGRPEAAFDWQAIGVMQQVAVPASHQLFLWHYPPPFLLMVLPLGDLPYLVALAVFVVATTALWAVFIRKLLPDPRTWIVAAATPAGLVNLLDGQNGFLTAALAGFALLLLDRRPKAAGLLIGLLVIKPHLALLFPVALIAAGRWRVIAAAAVTAIGFAAVSVAAFGTGTVAAFLHDLPLLREVVDRGGLSWGVMPSPYILVLSLGITPTVAMTVQGVVSLGAAVCVWRAWRAEGIPFEAKAAVLFAGSMLISPYLFTYDLTFAAVAIAFIALLGLRDGFRRGEPEILVLAWLVPVVAVAIYGLTGVQLGCLALFLLLLASVRRAAKSSASTAPASAAR